MLPTLSLDRYRRITATVVVAVGVIIVTGAAVRLTGSGLGCTEWPTCEQGRVVAPLETHAVIEFGNRLISGLIAVPVLAALVGAFAVRPRRRDLIGWSIGLVVGVGVNAVLGGILVKQELAPAFTTAHFLLSMLLVWNAVVLHHRAGTDGSRGEVVVDRSNLRLARLLVAMSALVLVTGTVVTGTGPHAGDEKAERYVFATITDVARVHSLAAWAFLVVAALVLWGLVSGGAPAQVHAQGRRLVAAIVFQGALGYAQYAAGVPPYLVIVHIAGAVVIFVASLSLYLSLFVRPETGGAPAPASAAPSVASA